MFANRVLVGAAVCSAVLLLWPVCGGELKPMKPPIPPEAQ